jgi:5,10-methylenetetrahydromethanopterin reductase
VIAHLEVSCGLPPGPEFADLAVLAETLGYSRVWVFDSAPLWEDPFVHLALAAERTTSVGLGCAVLVPDERSVMAMAAAIATIARLSQGRFLPCFGTGFTARFALGQRPMTIDALGEYVTVLRQLLAGESALVDGKAVRMLHAAGLTSPRPIEVPLWISAFGPRGTALAADIADGIIGPPQAGIPAAILTSGTVLDPGEDPSSDRVRDAIGPWRVVDWHTAYAKGGAERVDAMPGGEAWRREVEELTADDERHTATFSGHVTELTDRDVRLAEHIDRRTMVGDPTRIRRSMAQFADAGFQEVIYTPSGPDLPRELRQFAAAVAMTAAG